jgi:hypothetical protein
MYQDISYIKPIKIVKNYWIIIKIDNFIMLNNSINYFNIVINKLKQRH